MFDLLVLLILLASVAVSLLVTIPLTGALVRLRANYNPKGLQLDDEGNVEPHTGPVVTTFFGMLKRVKRIEGWAGLYKGLMPSLLETGVLTIFAVIALNADPRAHSRIAPPDSGILGTLAYSAFSIVLAMPMIIISYRAITTPYKLPYFRPMYSLRILLTPTERRRPWILYLTPGLFLAQFLHSAYSVIILRTLRRFLVPTIEDGDTTKFDIHPITFSIYVVVAVLSTTILCPLEVIITKLAIQRNHAAAEYNSVEQEVEPDAVSSEEYVEYSGAEEDVIGLRHEKDPYLGLVDCARRVSQEEGWQALYRVWWFSMLVGLTTAFA
ncbi:mitochondrial carrier [Cristinia sonorae]|uniref:Mitochondrial carrier n=1 Tax=Cristinia sonorae TaxID=1940300 RepID=A0A8K0UEZ3_9AGAR|nr:mitochondrial carrier [Cristinia sonorae]